MELATLIAIVAIAVIYLVVRTVRRMKGTSGRPCDCDSKDKCSGCNTSH